MAALYDGQLDWRDGYVRFHGNVEPTIFAVVPTQCRDVRGDLAGTGFLEFKGTYQPTDGSSSGSFTVDVVDFGQPGANADVISIELVGGAYDGYTNLGVLQGGNIEVF